MKMRDTSNALRCLLPALGIAAALFTNRAVAHEPHDIAFNEVGIPYGLGLALDDNASATTTPDHVGAWSWDEDGFPATAKGWTHTSKWVKLNLTKPARFTLLLESREGVPWPSSSDPARLAGTNLYPSFTIYRGWDTDAGITYDTSGVSIDQNHNFNNRGNIDWAEDVTYLDHLDNSTAHVASRTWTLPAGRYTIDLGGNSPATIAEGRQGYLATFTTTPARMFFDCFFYSVLNFSFFGFGDIMPQTIPAKIVTLLEVILAFFTVIFLLSDFISLKDSLRRERHR